MTSLSLRAATFAAGALCFAFTAGNAFAALPADVYAALPEMEQVTLSPDEMALLLVRRWKELGEIGLPSPWLPSLLEATYGSEEAARLTAD